VLAALLRLAVPVTRVAILVLPPTGRHVLTVPALLVAPVPTGVSVLAGPTGCLTVTRRRPLPVPWRRSLVVAQQSRSAFALVGEGMGRDSGTGRGPEQRREHDGNRGPETGNCVVHVRALSIGISFIAPRR
jgi:hypothetical protein